MCKAAFQINQRQWAVKELHPKESPCTPILMRSIITYLTSHKIWLLWELMRALNPFNFQWHGCNYKSCSELPGRHKPKEENKIKPSKCPHFCLGFILCANENLHAALMLRPCKQLPVWESLCSRVAWIQPANKSNGTTPIHTCLQVPRARLPSGSRCKYYLFLPNFI